MLRVGFGFDAHPLVKGRKLTLGGVVIPYHKGLSGHSDADVLLHALCDAILGALALGDLGDHFPDTDDRFKDISSLVLLEKVVHMAVSSGFKVCNVDCVVVAQSPRLKPFVKQMRSNIAKVLGVAEDCVSIKATTTEGMGFQGRGEGISAYAVVLLQKP
jgi:2-C-methyl-D-erythritol 2,4-cyclodiphosphate synthase